MSKEKYLVFHLLRYMIGLKNSRQFFIQSERKPKRIRALRQLHVVASSFDWLTGLTVSFVIGWSGFGFTTLN